MLLPAVFLWIAGLLGVLRASGLNVSKVLEYVEKDEITVKLCYHMVGNTRAQITVIRYDNREYTVNDSNSDFCATLRVRSIKDLKAFRVIAEEGDVRRYEVKEQTVRQTDREGREWTIDLGATSYHPIVG